MSMVRPLVVWQAGVTWDGIAGTDRHLVAHLVDHVDVLWVDPPTSVVGLTKERGVAALRPRLRTLSQHLTVVSPVAPPWPYRPGVTRITDALTARLVSQVVAGMGRTVDVVVSTSPDPRLDLVPGALRVYYATDDFTAGAHLMGKSPRRFGRIESRRVAEADVLGAVSHQIQSRWDTTGRDAFVMPNGCSTRHFEQLASAPWPADVNLPGPVAGMIGQLSARVDLGLLEAVADEGISLLLVGPHQPDFEPARVRRLLERSNVVWVGQKSYDELPSYMRVIDVGLTPYVADEFNLASFPLKTLEYLSAGRTVVSTLLPAVTQLQCPWVRTAATPAEFVRAVRESASTSGDATEMALKREFAAQHDWSERALQFAEAIGVASSDRSSIEVVDRETTS